MWYTPLKKGNSFPELNLLLMVNHHSRRYKKECSVKNALFGLLVVLVILVIVIPDSGRYTSTQAAERSCFANQRVLGGMVEAYNDLHPTALLKSFDGETTQQFLIEKGIQKTLHRCRRSRRDRMPYVIELFYNLISPQFEELPDQYVPTPVIGTGTPRIGCRFHGVAPEK
jgi:hypothetical protein